MANINLTLTPASPTGSLVFTIGMPGPGVPPSGLTGQILAKASNASYDTEWVNPLDVSAVWGQITGTLSNQTDLQTALDGKYSTSNPSGFINSSALTPYLTSATAASTYQTLSGMSSYLTISSAASTYQTQAAMSSYLTTSAAESIYYPLTNPNGYITSAALIGYALESWVSLELAGKAPLAAGVPVGGTTGQLLVKSSNTDYATGWTTIIPGDRYLTNSTTSLLIGNGSKTLTVGTGLSYSATQDATISLTSDQNNFHMHGKVVSYNSATGQLVVDVQSHTGSGTFNAWTVNVGGISPVATLAWGNITGTLSNQLDLQTALDGKYSTTNPAGYITSSALSPYLLSATAASTYYPLTNPAGYITSSALSPYLLSATAASTYYPLTNPAGYITSSALTGYAQLSGATYTGKVNLPNRVAGGIAYLNLGTVGDNVTVPTTLVEGDVFFHDTDATTGYNVRLAYTAKSFGGSLVNYSVAVLQNQNFFTQPNTISCTHNSQASLSVSQAGFGSGMTVTSTNTGANGAAFIIEQRGTGAAFVVRDEQSDPSPFTISNSGRVGIGASPDASAALKVDSGGIMFNDGTTQTTASPTAASLNDKANQVWLAQNFFSTVTSWSYDSISDLSTIYYSSAIADELINAWYGVFVLQGNTTYSITGAITPGQIVVNGDIRNSTGQIVTLSVGGYNLPGLTKYFN